MDKLKVRLVIWVTSDCNLHCPHCSQRHTMLSNKDYEMAMEEVNYIVQSCKERDLFFDCIEITGGEPSLWSNLQEGVKRFAEICNTVTLVTNGNEPEKILGLNLETWGVSATQATPEQLKRYANERKVFFNSHPHKKFPEEPVPDSLPAQCCVALSPDGLPQNNIMYLRGWVYYCCNAFALSKKAGSEDGTWLPFELDFISYFNNKKFDKKICSYCLCNQKIYNKL